MHQGNNKFLQKILLLVLMATTPLSVWSLASDKNQPFKIQSDQFMLDDGKKEIIYEGNVIYTQGTIKLTADKITVNYNGEREIQTLTAQGKPAIYREKPDEGKGMIIAKGNVIRYEAISELINLRTNASLKQNKDLFTAPEITYDLQKRIITSKGGRTEILMHPNGNKKPLSLN